MQRKPFLKSPYVYEKDLFYFNAFSIAFSCKKDSFSPTIKGIEGTWEFETFIGYPFNQPPTPAGNGRIIFIGSDRTFERRNFDTVISRSTYSLEEKKDCFGEEKYLFFKTTDPYLSESIITVENDKLILSSSNCLADGGTIIYRKSKIIRLL